MQNAKETNSEGIRKYPVDRYLLELSCRVEDKLTDEVDNKVWESLQ